MRSSPITFIDIPFEARLDHIMSGYAEYDITSLKEAVERIAKRLGGVETKNTLAFLDEGKIREAFAILLHYYDKKYFKSLYNREGIASLLTTVPLQKVEDRNAFVLMNKESKTTQDVRSH